MAWGVDGEALLVPDTLAGTVRVFRVDGTEAPPLALEASRPSRIQVLTDGTTLIQDGALDLLVLRPDPLASPDAALQRRLALDELSLTDGARLGALFEWAAERDGESGHLVLHGYGDVRGANQRWHHGWFRLTIDELAATGSLEFLRRARLDDPFRAFATMLSPFAASPGPSGTLLLDIDPESRVPFLRNPGLEGTPPPLPRRLARPVILPEPRDASEVGTVMAMVERLHLATGLHAHGERSWLLVRQPEPGDRATRWSAHTLTGPGTEAGTSAPLPSSAPHLVLAPGPGPWALLEKGPVRGIGNQDHGDLLLFPDPFEPAPSVGDEAADRITGEALAGPCPPPPAPTASGAEGRRPSDRPDRGDGPHRP